jgi:hypothetical protein
VGLGRELGPYATRANGASGAEEPTPVTPKAPTSRDAAPQALADCTLNRPPVQPPKTLWGLAALLIVPAVLLASSSG